MSQMRSWLNYPAELTPPTRRPRPQLQNVDSSAVGLAMPLDPELLLPGGQPDGSAAAVLAGLGLADVALTLIPEEYSITSLSTTVSHVSSLTKGNALHASFVVGEHDNGAAQSSSGQVHEAFCRLVDTYSGWLMVSDVPRMRGYSPSGASGKWARSRRGISTLGHGPCRHAPPTHSHGSARQTNRPCSSGPPDIWEPCEHVARRNLMDCLRGCRRDSPGTRLAITDHFTGLPETDSDRSPHAMTITASVMRKSRRTATVEVLMTRTDGPEAVGAKSEAHREDAQ